MTHIDREKTPPPPHAISVLLCHMATPNRKEAGNIVLILSRGQILKRWSTALPGWSPRRVGFHLQQVTKCCLLCPRRDLLSPHEPWTWLYSYEPPSKCYLVCPMNTNDPFWILNEIEELGCLWAVGQTVWSSSFLTALLLNLVSGLVAKGSWGI